MQKDLLLHGSIPIIYGKALWSFWRNTGEWNGCERVIFTQTRIGPKDGKGRCVEYARIFLHEKQANRPGRSAYRRYSYVCIKTPQPRLVSILRANQGIHRVQQQNTRVDKPPRVCSMRYKVIGNVLTPSRHFMHTTVIKKFPGRLAKTRWLQIKRISM